MNNGEQIQHERKAKQASQEEQLQELRKLTDDQELMALPGAAYIKIAERVLQNGTETNGRIKEIALCCILENANQELAGKITAEDINQIVQRFLNMNTDINYKTVHGSSILMFAVCSTLEVFKMILAKNPDVSLTSKFRDKIKGETVFDIFISVMAEAQDNGIDISGLKLDEKLALLEDHLRKIEQANKAQIETQGRPVLTTLTNHTMANLIMDYVEGEYPLSHQIQLPFVPRGRAENTIAFVKAEREN